MSDMHDKKIDDTLRAMTEWEGDAPPVWKRAAAEVKSTPPTTTRRSLRDLLHRRVPRPVLSAAALLLIVVLVVAALQTQQGPRSSISETNLKQFGTAHATYDNSWDAAFDMRDPTQSRQIHDDWIIFGTEGEGGAFLSGGGYSGSGEARFGGKRAGSTGAEEWDGRQWTEAPNNLQALTTTSLDRAVVRKATMQLQTPDVRAVYLKATHIVSQARGEFISDSALQGMDDSLQAHLTLRVVADRLDTVLNELRELGEVVSEESGGDDVTDQLVDLQARLRNEQRVEVELLELLQTRESAPLEDILELRRQIGLVRQQIERYEARAANINKLVSLATVLVIIRPAPEPQEEEDEVKAGAGAYFMENLSAAWNTGLTWLSDSIAILVRAIVGGLVWWFLVVLVVLFLRHLWRGAPAPSAQATD